MKKILLVTAGLFHPPLWGRLALHKVLASPFPKLGGGTGTRADFTFSHVFSLEKLPTTLSSFSALVLHFHHKTISDSALKKLDDFVHKGGGILAIHAATESYKQTLPYFKILGGRFIGHGKVERFKVERAKDNVFTGIGDFVVRDEIYLHELEPGIEVHFITKYEGRNIPIVWTYRYGRGKICYAVPGHVSSTMNNPMYRRILQRGLAWVIE
jgi:type 1 glutamine amidotransferase